MERLRERIAVARRALGTLEELLARPSPSTVERDAAIQRFEYSFEAAWKAVQRYLEVGEGLAIGSPKGVVRASLQVGLLDEQSARRALDMADDRNETSHAYNEALAVAIYARIPAHALLLRAWLEAVARATDRLAT